jgi:siroheme synthase-like protein
MNGGANVMSEKSYMPICVDLSRGRVIVVGGGGAAQHKLKSISLYTDRITIVAPSIADDVAAAGYTLVRRTFEPADLDGALLVYACTDNRDTNLQVMTAAHDRGILVNVCDDPASSDFVSPAIFKREKISVAVSSNGTDVRESIRIRDRIAGVLADDKA